jgi:hypothetical protein
MFTPVVSGLLHEFCYGIFEVIERYLKLPNVSFNLSC